MSLAAPHRVHLPRRTAIRTALGWNLVPLTVIVAGVLVAWTQTDNTENWALLAMIVLMVWGGGALIVSTGLGVAFAAALVRPMAPRAGGTYGHTVTERSAFRRGSLAALLGWLTMAVGLLVVVVVNQVLTDASVICC
jgi:hypothetical protein